MGIAIKSVKKSFEKVSVLKDVSLEIHSGELMALLGPSGSGKTTLLRIIAGLDSADSGVILFNGEDIGPVSVRDRHVGFVFQHYALFPHMTVFDNIAFGLRVKPRRERLSSSEIHEKVMGLLNLIQLDQMASRYPSQLSGGQRQRVALARALAIEPKILLLDEPFGALDAKVRKELRQWLRRLHQELKMTTVFVTHDVEEALEVSDRVAVMQGGVLEQVGTPSEVYHSPNSPFVYRFLGQVNVFHGRLDGTNVHLAGPETHDTMMYVRPHLLDIHKENPPQDAFFATVTQIYTLGPVIRVELSTEAGEIVQVDLSYDRSKELCLSVGETVYISIKESKTFSGDYSI